MIAAFLVRLYPRAWRARYGDEFADLLTDRGVGPFDVLDVILGALDARFNLRDGHGADAPSFSRGFGMSLRIGARAAMVGAVLWVAPFLISPIAPDLRLLWGTSLLVGSFLLIVALAGLSAFQARRHPTLVWLSVGLPTVLGVVVLGATIGAFALEDRAVVADLTPWSLMILALVGLVIGTALFAALTLRTGVLPRSGALLLGAGSVVAFLSMITPLNVLIALFPIGWLVLGWQVERDLTGRLAPVGSA